MKLVFIDECIDRVGGVERVLSTLANRFSLTDEVSVISEYRLTDTSFYSYSKDVSVMYLVDERKSKTKKRKEKDILYFGYRFFEKMKERSGLKKTIRQKALHVIKDADVLIFGRVFAALDFLPYLSEISYSGKIIVRDAIHLEYYDKKIQQLMLHYFPKYVNTFIVSSEESRNAYKKFFGNVSMNLVKIYNPLGIHPKGTFDFQKKTIVSIGRMDHQKGYENLIAACDKVFQKHKDWNLYIYGEGNYEKKIQKFLKKCTLSDHVKIFPSTKDVVSVFHSSSIFVLPSRYEGYANVLVEAMACGMPCISYNWLMGVEEMIQDKKNGIVVPLKNREDYFRGIDREEDVNSLALAIQSFIENEALCEQYAKEAKKIVDTRLIDVIINKWQEIIKS